MNVKETERVLSKNLQTYTEVPKSNKNTISEMNKNNLPLIHTMTGTSKINTTNKTDLTSKKIYIKEARDTMMRMVSIMKKEDRCMQVGSFKEKAGSKQNTTNKIKNKTIKIEDFLILFIKLNAVKDVLSWIDFYLSDSKH